MTLKLLQSICGHRYDGKPTPGNPHGRNIGDYGYPAGAEIEWQDENEARRMIDRGIATEVKKPNK